MESSINKFSDKLFFIVGIVEEEVVYVRFVNNGEPITKFAAIEAPESVNAAGLILAIQNAVASLQSQHSTHSRETYMSDLYKKLINVNFDGASVMSGHISGVQARFKKHQPGLIYTHCVAHRLELAVLDAIKFDDSYLEMFDQMINGIFKFYYYSAVHRKELKAIGDPLDEEFK